MPVDPRLFAPAQLSKAYQAAETIRGAGQQARGRDITFQDALAQQRAREAFSGGAPGFYEAQFQRDLAAQELPFLQAGIQQDPYAVAPAGQFIEQLGLAPSGPRQERLRTVTPGLRDGIPFNIGRGELGGELFKERAVPKPATGGRDGKGRDDFKTNIDAINKTQEEIDELEAPVYTKDYAGRETIKPKTEEELTKLDLLRTKKIKQRSSFRKKYGERGATILGEEELPVAPGGQETMIGVLGSERAQQPVTTDGDTIDEATFAGLMGQFGSKEAVDAHLKGQGIRYLRTPGGLERLI